LEEPEERQCLVTSPELLPFTLVVVVEPTAMAQEPLVVPELEAREVEQMPEPMVQLTQALVVVVLMASRVVTEDQV
jgi:hypothetical protein